MLTYRKEIKPTTQASTSISILGLVFVTAIADLELEVSDSSLQLFGLPTDTVLGVREAAEQLHIHFSPFIHEKTFL
jgi:hypothetical protein